MSTWSELQEYARAQYELDEDNDDSFRLVFEYESGRLQSIVVSRFEAIDREWVDFASPACTSSQLAAETALQKNFTFVVGALSLDEDIYVVRYSLPMERLSMKEFESLLRIIAVTADKLEEEFGAGDAF